MEKFHSKYLLRSECLPSISPDISHPAVRFHVLPEFFFFWSLPLSLAGTTPSRMKENIQLTGVLFPGRCITTEDFRVNKRHRRTLPRETPGESHLGG